METRDGQRIKQYIPVPREMLDKAKDMGFSAQEQRVFWTIVEKTIGYEDGKTKSGDSIRRIEQPLSPKYVTQVTGVPERTVRDIYKKFEQRGIVDLSKKPFTRSNGMSQQTTTVTINTTYAQWQEKRGTKTTPQAQQADSTSTQTQSPKATQLQTDLAESVEAFLKETDAAPSVSCAECGERSHAPRPKDEASRTTTAHGPALRFVLRVDGATVKAACQAHRDKLEQTKIAYAATHKGQEVLIVQTHAAGPCAYCESEKRATSSCVAGADCEAS